MNKPRNYTLEDGRIWNIRRSTAEALHAQGMIATLPAFIGHRQMVTRYELTAKGAAFFALAPGRRFKWIEDAPEPRRKTVADYFAASLDPASDTYVPLGAYPDECAA